MYASEQRPLHYRKSLLSFDLHWEVKQPTHMKSKNPICKETKNFLPSPLPVLNQCYGKYGLWIHHHTFNTPYKKTRNVSPTSSPRLTVSIDVQREEGSPYSDPFQNQISRNALYLKTQTPIAAWLGSVTLFGHCLKRQKAIFLLQFQDSKATLIGTSCLLLQLFLIILIMVLNTNFNKELFKKTENAWPPKYF